MRLSTKCKLVSDSMSTTSSFNVPLFVGDLKNVELTLIKDHNRDYFTSNFHIMTNRMPYEPHKTLFISVHKTRHCYFVLFVKWMKEQLFILHEYAYQQQVYCICPWSALSRPTYECFRKLKWAIVIPKRKREKTIQRKQNGNYEAGLIKSFFDFDLLLIPLSFRFISV